MKKQFVTYEIALKLKELGFDEHCIAYYAGETLLSEFVLDHSRTISYTQTNDGYEMSAPLWQQVIEWFWINYKILIVPYLVPDKTETIMWLVKSKVEDYYHNREQAILKAIEICKYNKT